MYPQFPETYSIRLPPGFGAALATLARRHYRTVQDEIRQILANGLDAAGVQIDPDAPKPNGWPANRKTAQVDATKNGAAGVPR
jgi:plasmid stability protein